MSLVESQFVTLEGVEGSGKTTQMAALARFLDESGVPCVVTREPGGTAVGEAIRAVLLDPDHHAMSEVTELMLYAAARAQHLAEVIEPALADGKIVLCDRYKDATRAYQGYGRGLPLDLIEQVHAVRGLTREPDLTLLLDHPVEEGLQRARARQTAEADRLTRFEDEEIAFHRRVRSGYLRLAGQAPQRFVVVDATGTMDEVQAKLRRVLAGRLGLEAKS